MANVTLVGEKIAREGLEFIFLGPCQDCRDCRVKTVCFNLEEGRTYRITGVREMTHQCAVHEGPVRAVEYEPLPIYAAVESGTAHEGERRQISAQICKRTLCQNYRVCVKSPARRRDTFKVVSIECALFCPLGRTLTKVRVEPD